MPWSRREEVTSGEIRIYEPDTPAPSKPSSRIIASRPLRCIRPPPLHRPERLQDAQVLRHDLDLV